MGDRYCNICNHYMDACSCSSVLKNLLTQKYGQQEYGDVGKVLSMVDDLEQLGCSCKVSEGYRCSVHDKVRELKYVLFKIDVSVKN